MSPRLFPAQEIGSLQKPSLDALGEWEGRLHFLSRLGPVPEEVLRHPDSRDAAKPAGRVCDHVPRDGGPRPSLRRGGPSGRDVPSTPSAR